jgi:porphobilinogen synthase
MKRQMKKLSKQTYPSLRMRRLRNNSGIRKLISETKLTVDNLVQPIFVTEGKNKT